MKLSIFLVVVVLEYYAKAMKLEPLPKYHVNDLSVQDFDLLFLDKKPLVLVGTTACPGELTLENIEQYCGGTIPGYHLNIKTKEDGAWAGLKEASTNNNENIDFLDFVKSMGSTNTPLRFLFDVFMAEVCPTLLPKVNLPAHLVNVFASQFLWRSTKSSSLDDSSIKCSEVPFFNLYLAEDGFETDLHIDDLHTAFLASMCTGTKKWRVIAPDEFAKFHSKLSNKENNSGYNINGKWMMSQISQPFETWADNDNASILNSLDIVVYEGSLEPGEILYIPPGAPHAAATIGNSLMVASNDQSLNSLQEMNDYCSLNGDNWIVCSRYSERFSIVEKNWRENFLNQNINRQAMSFAQSYGCEDSIALLSKQYLEINGNNFISEIGKSEGSPLLVMKYSRRCLSCLYLLHQLEEELAMSLTHGRLRIYVMNCLEGMCPPPKSSDQLFRSKRRRKDQEVMMYQRLIRMSRKEAPEFVLVTMPQERSNTVRGAIETGGGAFREMSVSHYYGPLDKDFLVAWITRNAGISFVDENQSKKYGVFWKNVFIYVYLLVLDIAAYCMFVVVGIPPTVDELSVLILFVFVTFAIMSPCFTFLWRVTIGYIKPTSNKGKEE